MEKVEQYIKDYTRNCSNEYLTNGKLDVSGGFISRRKFSPWLTPDNARKVAEIAKEETIKEVCELLKNNIAEYILPNKGLDIDWFIEDLKKCLEDKVWML